MGDVSTVVHRGPGGERLYAVLSLHALDSLDGEKINALRELGVHTVADLLHYVPVHRARIVAAYARGAIAHDFDLRSLITDADVTDDRAGLGRAPATLIDGVGAATGALLETVFGVRTVAELAEFAPFLEAERLFQQEEAPFSEPASAPEELLPRRSGAVASLVRYGSFVFDLPIPLSDAQLVAPDKDKPELSTIFEGTLSKANVGYVALHVQRWINLGTQLGEIAYTMGLAPGESRNVAVVDWRRSHLTKRDENTGMAEWLASDVLQTRALDEVAQAVAIEHQYGRTMAIAATGVTGLGAVAAGAAVGAAAGGASMAAAGTVTGVTVGALVGAAVGTAADGATVPGVLAGAAIGGVVGMAAGGAAGTAGGALVGGLAGGIGFIVSESKGDRRVVGEDRQNIMQLTSQKASLARSLRSSIVVEDYQGESTRAQTYNVTNYNHAHSLNLCYYELLQRYHVELRTERLDAFLAIPFRPLDFSMNMIVERWYLLRPFLPTQLAEAFDELIEKGLAVDTPPPFNVDSFLKHFRVKVVHPGFLPNPMPSPEKVRLIHEGHPNGRPLNFVHSEGTPVTFEEYTHGGDGIPLKDIHKIRVTIPPHGDGWYRVTVRDLTIDDQTTITNEFHLDNNVEYRTVGAGGQTDLDFDFKPFELLSAHEQARRNSAAIINQVERLVRSQRYRFTRVVLSSLEPEEMTQIMGDLSLQMGGVNVALDRLVDPTPIGYSGTFVLFQMRPGSDLPAEVAPIAGYPTDLENWYQVQVKSGRTLLTEQVHLPTQGVFVEALLGRANSAEKIDLSRFWNWQDSPIPNAAPAIDPSNTGSRRDEPLPTNATVVPAVLSVATPANFPDPNMAALLGAIQNGNIFRDMSKSGELTTLMGSLASVAERAAAQAGTLAGAAATKALESATELAKSVADLSQKMLAGTMSSLPELKAPENITHEGGRLNAAEEAAMPPSISTPPPAATTPPAPPAVQPSPTPPPQSTVPSPQRGIRRIPLTLQAEFPTGELFAGDWDLAALHPASQTSQNVHFDTGRFPGFDSYMLTHVLDGDCQIVGNVRPTRPQAGVIGTIEVPIAGAGLVNIHPDVTRELDDITNQFFPVTGPFSVTRTMQAVRIKATVRMVDLETEHQMTIGATAGGAAGIETEAKLQIGNFLTRLLADPTVGTKVSLNFDGELQAGQTTAFKIKFQKMIGVELRQEP